MIKINGIESYKLSKENIKYIFRNKMNDQGKYPWFKSGSDVIRLGYKGKFKNVIFLNFNTADVTKTYECSNDCGEFERVIAQICHDSILQLPESPALSQRIITNIPDFDLYVITYSSDINPKDLYATIGHELGHIFNGDLDLDNDGSVLNEPEKEIKADEFAYELIGEYLHPSRLYREYLKKICAVYNIPVLKRIYFSIVGTALIKKSGRR